MRIVGYMRGCVRRALGASTPLIGGRVVSAALTFVLPFLLARLLTPTAFGTYKQFFLIATTVQLTAQLGLTQSLYYFLPRAGVRRGAYLSQSVLSLALLGVLFGSLLWISMSSLGRWIGDGTLATVRTPLSLYVALMLTAAPLECVLVSEGRVAGAALTYVLTDGARVAALVLGAYWRGTTGLFWAAAATALARVVALLALAVARVLPVQSPRLALYRRQLAYALPFAGATYFFVAQRYFSQYAISAKFDAATFALFAVASFHMPVVDIIFTPMSDIMMVSIGQAERDGGVVAVRAIWNDTVQKMAFILFPVAACAWLFGATLLPLLFTQRYAAAVPLFWLATFEIPLCILPLDALLRAAGATRFLFVCNAVRIVVTCALVVGGIEWLGLAGAIVGGIASEALARIGMMWRASRFLHVRVAAVCDWPPLLRTAAVAAFAALPAYGVRWLNVADLSAVAVGAAAYAATYLFALTLLRRRETPSRVHALVAS